VKIIYQKIMNRIQNSNREIKIEQNSNKIKNEVEQATQEPKLSSPIMAHKKNVKIKNLIKETLYNSFAQAIIKIIETPYYILKIFLFIFVIASSGICSFLIIELILNYYMY
jgi:hypothetical protein